MAGSRKRKAIRVLMVVAAVTITVAVSMPLWFPWALRPLLAQYGLRFEKYDRLGYARFALEGVHGTWRRTRFEARRVEGPLPSVWLWRRQIPDPQGPPLVTAVDWRLVVQRSGTKAADSRGRTLFGALDDIAQLGARLRHELPSARLTNGIVEIDSQKVRLPGVDWRGGRLQARLDSQIPAIALIAGVENASAFTVSAAIEKYDASIRGKFRRESGKWRLAGEVGWLTNRAELTAEIPRTGSWPVQARLEAGRVRVPAELLGLRGYDDLTASFALNVVSNRFDLEATGLAQPAPGPELGALPEVRAALRARGDPASAILEELRVQAPWLQAELTEAIGIKPTGELLLPAEAARLRIAVDLGKLPGASRTGALAGDLAIELKEEFKPVARFHLTGTNLVEAGLEIARFDLAGGFDWPVLEVEELAAEFEDGSKFNAGGNADVVTRRITEGTWRLAGRVWEQFLPTLDYAVLEASGQMEGPLTNLQHSGEIRIQDLQREPLNPLGARIAWQGRNFQIGAAEIELSAGGSVLSLAGAVELTAREPLAVRATLRNALWRRGEEALYHLEAPCEIKYRAGNRPESNTTWKLAIDAFRWQGDGRELFLAADLDWPAEGRVQGRIQRLAVGDFSDFAAAFVTNVSLANLQLDAHWSNGPIRSVTVVRGTVIQSNGQNLEVQGTVRSGDALEIDRLEVKTGFAPALIVDGMVPAAVVPGRAEGWLRADDRQSLTLRAHLGAVDEFSFAAGRLGELKIIRPRLELVSSGTLERPSASLEARVERLNWVAPSTNAARPSLEKFHLSASIQPERIDLRRLTAELDGQPIQAAGLWPLPAGSWKRWVRQGRLPDWSQARGWLRMNAVQAAPLARYLPGILAPEGRLSADLALEGGELNGRLELTNAASRPLGNLAPLRDIAARIRFGGQEAALETFEGQIGGQPVRATGRLARGPRGEFQYQANLRGTNVPLARSGDFLLRGDFQLQLEGGRDSPALVTGEVKLHDGLFVQHATALMLSQPERPALRPPYFTVGQQPFSDWNLNVRVRGDQFLRVRSPVFNGVVSADLKLQGTLREPVVIGDGRVNSGRVRFPFGTLEVDHAYANLSGNDPRGPDLAISASGRVFRYQIRLEVRGPADGANVLFTSIPPLSSEEILLMLTAGELPRKEYIFSDRAKAGRLVTFLGRDILSRFTDSDMEGGRLIINSGENISEEGKTTYSVEYRLTERWSIIGEYDRFNALNAAVKWKIYSR